LLLVIGVNYHQTPVAVREALAPGNQHFHLMDCCLSESSIRYGFMLSTCNRCEIYCFIDWASSWSTLARETPTELKLLCERIKKIWQDALEVDQVMFEQAQFFQLIGGRALEHLARVGAGLDAMILGEPQIFGQLKHAISVGQGYGHIGVEFLQMLNHTIEIVKRVRTQTNIGRCAVSFASSIYHLASRLFTDVSKTRILFIGAGDMIELICRHFFHQQCRNMVVLNRTLANTESLVCEFAVHASALSELDQWLVKADIVVACTASHQPILIKSSVQQALAQRKHKPLFLVDLAVPRNIDATVEDLEDAFLYTVDDIYHFIKKNEDVRLEAAEQAHQLIEQGVDDIIRKLQFAKIAPTIAAYRLKAENSRLQALIAARKRLMRGDDIFAVIESLSKSLTNKLTHQPTLGLKEMAVEGSDELLIAKQVLGLDKDV